MNYHFDYMLETWFPKDDKRHKGLKHPVMGLCSEIGELIGELDKQEFKPGYDQNLYSLINKELGDVWYYIRAMAYCLDCELGDYQKEDTDSINGCLSLMIADAGNLFVLIDSEDYELDEFALKLAHMDLLNVFAVFLNLLGHFNIDLDWLSEDNYNKLVDKQSGKGKHGWDTELDNKAD